MHILFSIAILSPYLSGFLSFVTALSYTYVIQCPNLVTALPISYIPMHIYVHVSVIHA